MILNQQRKAGLDIADEMTSDSRDKIVKRWKRHEYLEYPEELEKGK